MYLIYDNYVIIFITRKFAQYIYNYIMITAYINMIIYNNTYQHNITSVLIKVIITLTSVVIISA